jgi:hypothetical protein
MSHYVCTGDCQTVSDVPGVCNADYCGKNGQAMTICGCEDNEHEDAATEKESSSDEEQE